MDHTQHQNTPADLIRLPGFVVDLASEQLLTEGGVVCELRPQAFAVLRHLALRVGHVVTKKELLNTVWEGMAVTDDSLVQTISDIRRALHDPLHQLIKTVPRRGYMLVRSELAEPTCISVAPQPKVLSSPVDASTTRAPTISMTKHDLYASAFFLVWILIGLIYWNDADDTTTKELSDPSTTATLAVLPFSASGQTGETELLARKRSMNTPLYISG
ncbi:winged helix-turn-helix domain-containing protein [Noviherbaspirillum malthae]|uniref:winged helix-turn-helix domain-containing protein n=1 Tax=Noviherbaspirillum malthae TaxID=1260987 RepID=UPI00188E4745|nr:winged helix-turn-helix domain-containing protein [Noviherbaspirillum malthae]